MIIVRGPITDEFLNLIDRFTYPTPDHLQPSALVIDMYKRLSAIPAFPATDVEAATVADVIVADLELVA